MDITAHIRALIGEYDYVVIPGLGGFVANYQPAQRHPVTHQFQPPAKQLSFNKQLQQNDALLLHRLVETEALHQQAAKEAIENFAKDCQQKLQRQEVLRLDGIGKLFYDIEHTLQFVQTSDNHLPASYGLPSYKATPIMRHQLVDTSPATNKEVAPHIPLRKPLSMQWLPWAAAVSILVVLFTVFFTVPTVKESTQQWFGYDTALVQPVSYAGMQILPLPDNRIADGFPITISLDDKAQHKMILSPVHLETPLSITANHALPKGYFIVVGSFTKESNAVNLNNQLTASGYDAHIFPTTAEGFTRVGVFASGNSLVAANKLVLTYRNSLQPTAWIIRNNHDAK